MKLIYDKTCKISLKDRIILLFSGTLRLRLWFDPTTQRVKFNLQSKDINGSWDNEQVK
jgi:hypothetical protein